MASASPEANVDVGRVISRGFATLSANFLPFLLISLVLAGLPSFALQYWRWITPADPRLDWTWALGALLLSLVASTLLTGALVRSTILHVGGRDPAPGASALLALRLLPALIGLSVLLAVAIGIGLVLLIVPGVMIYCATSVAVPALMEENCGVFGSIERSRELTRGSRWPIFAIVVLLWIIGAVIAGVAGQIAMLGADETTGPVSAVAAIAEAMSGSLSTMIIAVVTAALYVELREVKEGASIHALADVFA